VTQRSAGGPTIHSLLPSLAFLRSRPGWNCHRLRRQPINTTHYPGMTTVYAGSYPCLCNHDTQHISNHVSAPTHHKAIKVTSIKRLAGSMGLSYYPPVVYLRSYLASYIPIP
jgi:hypothetical protein